MKCAHTEWRIYTETHAHAEIHAHTNTHTHRERMPTHAPASKPPTHSHADDRGRLSVRLCFFPFSDVNANFTGRIRHPFLLLSGPV